MKIIINVVLLCSYITIALIVLGWADHEIDITQASLLAVAVTTYLTVLVFVKRPNGGGSALVYRGLFVPFYI